MAEQKSTQQLDTEFALRRFKERIAAAIAGIVVVGTVAMLMLALQKAGSFEQIKDVLLIVTPLVGVVLGYYFNKVSTEARAENAEATAKQAVVTAQEASKAREEAQATTEKIRTDLNATQKEAVQTKTVLREVTTAAEKVLVQEKTAVKAAAREEDAAGILSPRTVPSAPPVDALADLQSAIDRARRILD